MKRLIALLSKSTLLIHISEVLILDINNVVNNVQIYGLEESILRSGYPLRTKPLTGAEFATVQPNEKDYRRAINLGKAATGTGHDVFLTGIIVQMDLTLPIKVWTELQRYHFIDFISSQSTMHCITKFDLSDPGNYSVHTNPFIIDKIASLAEEYKTNPTEERLQELLYSLPVGFKLTAGMTTNYRQLKTIYQQRHNHRLEEWRVICKWIESLPGMSKFLKQEDEES